MKPMIILPPDTMTVEDIALIRENGICVVVSKDPAKVRFMDPIPATHNRTQMEFAAIKLSRILINRTWGAYTNSPSLSSGEIAHIYCKLLIEGTALDRDGSIDDKAVAVYEAERLEEARRLARADARAEREAKKKSAQEVKK